MNIIYPPRFSNEELKKAEKIIIRALYSLGIENGPSHIELIRKDPNNFVVIEVAARGGGFWTFSHIVPAVSGVDTMKKLIQLAVGNPIHIESTLSKSAVLRFTTSTPGRVVALSGVEEAKKLKGVIKAGFFPKIGDLVKLLKSDSDRVGYMLISADEREEAINISDQVASLLVAETVEDNSYNSFLSNRIYNIQPSVSMEVSEKAQELRRKGEPIIDLSIGEPNFATPKKVKSKAIEALQKDFTHYTSARGIQELRNSIAQKMWLENKVEADPEKNIIVTPGVKQALYYLNCCLINPGDEAIICEPYWLTYVDSLKLCGGKPKIVTGLETNDFKPFISDIEKAITTKTKYILFSNPNNPTGFLWNKEELIQLINLAQKYDLLLISDEIYENIVFEGESFISAASLPGIKGRIITLSGYSKGPAMSGWRLGYVIAPEEIIVELVKLQQQIATCPSSISQYAACEVLFQKEEIKAMVLEYKQRRDLLVDGLNKIKGFKCSKPSGAFYVFVNIEELKMSSLEVAKYLLEKAKIAVIPGIAYGENCDNYLRFSFAVELGAIREALIRLEGVFGIK